tara:strand:- start:3267 stop:4835 length:1569 start_codon:yes stop_codon:yes gene_type:complete
MCGIIAVIKGDVDKKKLLLVLTRRGPDEQGTFVDDDVYMGHTRLSIVHPEAGPQPFFYQNWVVTMNGEIYNSNAKDNETDCFLVPKLLERYGIEAVRRLDGIFSFVAYNRDTKRIIVARDAIGVTPLYWSQGNGITFASLLAAMPQNEPVQIVPPGHIASFKVGELPTFTQWRTPYIRKCLRNEPNGNIVNLMTQAVAKRLMGDVPWGVLLSGGLDSTIVASLAVKLAPKLRPDYPVVHTFCIGLKDSPDVKWAKEVAQSLGTHHTSVEYTVEEGINCIPEVIKAVETYDVTTIRASTPMWLLGKALKARGIKMVLSGEGSDELFAGYLYNLYCPNETKMIQECILKMNQLHAYDCQRANKSMGDWGVETRVPFLDKDVVNFAMNLLPPVNKLSGTHPEGPKPEKWWLREAFQEIVPKCVINRTKAQFSDAVGNEWIESLVVEAKKHKSDATFEYNTPTTDEAHWYRKVFEQCFSQKDAEKTVLYTGKSIACSTSSASEWNKKFQKHLDPSGQAIHNICDNL